MTLPTTKWRALSKDGKERWRGMLQSGHLSDCTFLVGDGSERFRAHRLVLASISPVFQAMLYGDPDKGSDPIRIPDIEPNTFNKLLQYIYSDDLKLDNVEDAFELYCYSYRYIIPQLTSLCVDYLKSNIKPENACQIYEFGKLFNDVNIIEKSLEFIRTETSKVLSDGNINNVTLETLDEIYEQEFLAVGKELELFKVAETYAMQSLLSSPSDSTRLSIRNIIQKIRFLTMTPREFTDNVGISNLLSDSEKLTVLMQLAAPINDFVMLEGFTPSTDTRLWRFVTSLKDEHCNSQAKIFTEKFTVVNNTLHNHFQPQKDIPTIEIVGIEISTQQGTEGEMYNEHVEAHFHIGCIPNTYYQQYRTTLTSCNVKQNVPYNATQRIIFKQPYTLEMNMDYTIKLDMHVPGTYLCGKKSSSESKIGPFTINFKNSDYNGIEIIRAILCKLK